MGTPVTGILAPTMGWISTSASSKLFHLPLRYFDSSFTALLDCGASHNFISEDLVNRIGTVPPMKVDPMPIRLADQSVMTLDHSVTLSIRFTSYHVCEIAFRIVPTLTHGVLLRMEWFSSFSLVVGWTSRVVTLNIDGESLELKCVMPQCPPITISTAEQLDQMLSNLKCKHKAFAIYIHPLEGAPEHATLQAMTGHPDLSTKPTQSPSVLVSSANPTHSDNTTSSRGNAGKASTWDNLCHRFSDLFEAPGFPVESQIKHPIDSLNPNLPVKHHRQYNMFPTELEEVHSQLDALLAKGWI